MRPWPRVLLVATITGSLLSSPLHAGADPGLVLTELRVDEQVRTVDVTVSAPGLQPGTGLDPASLVATVDGRTLPATSVTPARTPRPPVTTVLMVVDTSGSMAGQPMLDAKTAINAFVAQAPAHVRLGLLSFSTSPRLLVPPTADRAVVLGAVAGLRAQGETSLYDAVRAGLAAVGRSGDRRIVVLSDGGDTRSRSTLGHALADAQGSGVLVDAVAFNTDESVADVLSRIAGAGDGRVHTAASSAELASALQSSTRQQATTVTLQLLVPEDLRGPHRLSVSASAAGVERTADVAVQLGVAPSAAPPAPRPFQTDNALLVGLAAIATSLLLASFALMGGRQGGRRRTHEVLDRFTTATRATPPKQDVRTASPVARTALELADRVASKRNRKEGSALRLARAAVSMTPAEWLLLQVGVSSAALLVLVLLGSNLLLALVVGTSVGAGVPALYLRIRGGRRQQAFEDKLPDALQMTAGGLSAGYSLAQALDGLVQEGTEPMATEIGKALAESRLGIPVETTLQGVADRMGSRDFGWVVMAIRVQRQVGGNLAGVLSTVSATMRERAMLRRHVRGLSAEGRLSAYILIGLPISLALFMYAARREYLLPLYTTGLGLVLIAVAVALLSLGILVMSRMVKVEV